MRTPHAALVWALLSMASLGIANYLYKRVGGALGPVNATFYYYLAVLPLAAGIWLARPEPRPDRSLAALALLGLFTISMLLSNLAYAFATTGADALPASHAAAIRSLFPALTVLLACSLGGERLSWRGILGIVLAIAAGVLVALDASPGAESGAART